MNFISTQILDDENCETLQSEIHITKGNFSMKMFINFSNADLLISEEYDEMGQLKRTCNGDVSVTKCEGFCNSQVQPSVVTPTGFSKVSNDNEKQKLNY